MAKEEVDENDPGEEEEAEEEEQRPKKRRGPRSRRGEAKKRGGPLGDPRLYHRDVPTGPDGIALEDVPMDLDRIERIGGFDEESVRITENMKRYIGGKASGAADIRFNGRSREKYFVIRKVHHGAIIAIKQVHPVLNEALPPTNMSACPTYDALLQFVKERYWKGEDAIYEWQAYTENKAALGIGRFQFASEPDWEPGGRREPQHQQVPQHQPQQQNPFQQFQPPYGMQIPGMPPMFFGQPPQQQQPAPIVAPPPGTEPVIAALMQQNAQLMQSILAMTGNQAAVQTYLQGLPGVIEQKVKEATPPPAPPAAPPPPPPTPVEQVQQASELVQTITRMGRQLAHTLAPQQAGEIEQTPPATGEDDFPLQVRRVGLMNVVAQDGKVVDNALLNIGANAGPMLGLVEQAFKRYTDSKKETTELEIKRLEAEERREQQKLTNLREAAKLKQELEAPQRFVAPDPTPPERWQAPSWAADPPPVEPKPTS